MSNTTKLIDVKIIQDYLELNKNVRNIIKKSGYRNNYIIGILGIEESTFYKKASSGKFSPEELLVIAGVVNRDDQLPHPTQE